MFKNKKKEQKMLIGTLGLIGSGKGTVAEHLVQHYGFRQDSFASTLKDVCSTLFNWDRNMLEGVTPGSRQAREVVDHWWAEKLGNKDFTPRLALQLIGTELFRNQFHKDIWVLSVVSRYKQGEHVVISDVRFPNEIAAIKDAGGILIKVERGTPPEWWNAAVSAAAGDLGAERLMREYYKIHESEWAWANVNPDAILTNNGTLDELYYSISELRSKYGF